MSSEQRKGMASLAGSSVFITGASGFLGGALALRLAQSGAAVTALTRSPEKANLLHNQNRITLVRGDITNQGGMFEILQGADFIFHTAVSYGGWQEQRAVNVDGTRYVMEAAAASGAKRVIHVSSIAVYGYSRSGHVSEADAPRPVEGEAYNISKIQAEAVVREIGQQRGLSYAIIRPGMIYGPRSGAWTDRLMRHVRRRPILWVGDGSGSTFPIYVADVVDMMALLALHPSADGEVFNCVYPVPVTWREFLMAYGQLAGNQSWLGLPLGVITAGVSLAAALSPVQARVKVLPEMLTALHRTLIIDMSKARERLDWQPQVDLRTGIANCIPYLREKGLLT